MSVPDDILDILQADIFATLQNVPELALAQVFRDDEESLQSRVDRALALRGHAGGKAGLAVIVEAIEAADTEVNLPGPVMRLVAKVVTIENVSVNRSAAKGTGIKSSQAAMRVLKALHLRSFGVVTLHAERKPITPQNLAKGISSHLVTVSCLLGASVADKVGAVSAEMVTVPEKITVFGFITSDGITLVTFPDLLASDISPSGWTFTSNGGDDPGTGDWYAVTTWGGVGSLIKTVDGMTVAAWAATPSPLNPAEATWLPQGSATGYPLLTLVGSQELQLTCDTAGASIYYTTDGSYPTPTNGTLYAAPIAGLEVGDHIRAAAYAPDMNPGDVLDFTLIE